MSSQTLLAWCSNKTNKIDIADFNTKQSYASFDGVKISDNSTTSILNHFEADML